MKLAITGATGYIGTTLVRHAQQLGYEVVALTRREARQVSGGWIPFDFENNNEIELPMDTTAVVHLAATTDTAAVDRDVEVSAARRLISAAKHAGASFIFVSSQTAREDAPTNYGRVKWRIEQEALAVGGVVVRPGQVYGGPERALFGTLVSLVRRLPVIPAFLPPPKIQPIHVDDLAKGILAAIGDESLKSTILRLGSPKPISFTSFLSAIATDRVRRHLLSIPVPIVAVRVLSKLIGPVSTRVGLDRLVSLFELRPMDTESDLRRLGLTLRSLSLGMHLSSKPERYGLIREAQALLAYVLRTRPSPVLVRRYVRCIEQVRDGKALELPNFVFRAPSMLALLEGSALKSSKVAEFVWRLNAAAVFAEASPQGAIRFLQVGIPSGFLHAAFDIGKAIASEAIWRIGRILLTPVLAPTMRRRGLWN